VIAMIDNPAGSRPRPTARDMAPWVPLLHKVAQEVCATLPAAVRREQFDELVQDGTFGLAAALRAFDPGRGVQFTTYAWRRIKGAMLDGIRHRDAFSRQMRAADDCPLILPMDMVVARAEDHHDARTDLCLGHVLPAKDQAQTDWLTEGGYLEELGARERLIMRLYWGEQCTMAEIGRAIGLSESRISQIISTLVKGLKGRLRSRMRMEQLVQRIRERMAQRRAA